MIKVVFEIYKDKKGEWRWRARAKSNKKILLDSGEGYKRRSACEKARRSFIEHIANRRYDFNDEAHS